MLPPLQVVSCSLSWCSRGVRKSGWQTLDYLLIPKRQPGDKKQEYEAMCAAYLRQALNLPEDATMMIVHMQA